MTRTGNEPVQLSPNLRARLAAVVGSGHVETAATALRSAGTATFATTNRVAAIVRPADRAEVQECVRLANRFGTALYPVSRGRNWGYGSRVPTSDGAILLSLDRMDRIVGHDEQLGHVTVQPGVTFAALDAYLAGRGSDLYVGSPGSTPLASVVGNTLERGILAGLHPDRAAQVCALEVVLPTGAFIRTGMAALPASATAQVHRWGLGPSLDGLFSQSNLGIVTEMTVWLDRLPARRRHLSFRLAEPGRLGPLVDALQGLAREGTVAPAVGLHNAWKVLALQGRYPFEETGGATPLPAPVRDRLVAELGGAWFGEAAVHGPTDGVLDGLCARAEEVLGDVVDELIFSGVNDPGPILGEGSGHGLQQAYWRKPAPPGPNPDPDRDRCGVIWHAPAIPFRAADAVRVAAIVERVVPAHGFEPMLSLQAVGHRCVYAVASLVYDRDVAGEDERAARCQRALAAELASAGAEPYRLGVAAMEDPPAQDPEYRELLHKLKRALDPNHVLAPGRYDFGAPPPR